MAITKNEMFNIKFENTSKVVSVNILCSLLDKFSYNQLTNAFLKSVTQFFCSIVMGI